MKKTLHNKKLATALLASWLLAMPVALMAQDRWNDGIYSTPDIRTIKSSANGGNSKDVRMVIPYGSNIKISKTNYISSLPGQAGTNVYPNPVIANARVVFNSSENGLPYEVYMISIDGKPLLRKTGATVAGTNTVNLEMSSYPLGTYMLQLVVGNTKEMIRLIKAVR